MKRRSLALLAAVLIALAVAVAGTARAAAGVSPNPSIHFTPSPVHAGAFVRVHGSAGGCPVGDTVTILSRAFSHSHAFAGVPAVTTPVRAYGGYSKKVQIPAWRRPAVYRATARCGGGTFGVVARVHVLPE